MKPLSFLISKYYPYNSEAKVDKLISAIATNKIEVTPGQDDYICTIIKNPNLVSYFHKKLFRAKEVLEMRRKATSIIKPGNMGVDNGMGPDDPMNVAIKRNKQFTSNRIKTDDDFEYGLSDW